MSRYHSYINTATLITEEYRGLEPLAAFLKQFFAREKKYGSSDRKQISALTYHYYRAANAIHAVSKEEKFLAASFLCEQKHSAILAALRPEWNELIQTPLAEKIRLLGNDFEPARLFPFIDHLSPGIDLQPFTCSFLQQPKLFLRARPGYQKTVVAKLKAVSIDAELTGDASIALPNGSKIDEEIRIDVEAVVQDYNSQQVGAVIRPFLPLEKKKFTLWDCCAASGGKSIMLYDIFPKFELTVSDIRQSILHNLRKRFQRAGIQNYQSFTTDLTGEGGAYISGKYDMILADVPCTGSGTWARTPEQLYFFKKEAIDEYVSRQQKIVDHIVPCLNNNGLLIYITCSVFEKENESMAAYIMQSPGLELRTSQLLKGYNLFADTMFVAVFSKSS